MFNREQYDILLRCSSKGDMTEWNKWRRKNPEQEILLEEAQLKGADLFGADLSEARLNRADLREADLCEANLIGATLFEAQLNGADLLGTYLGDVDLRGVDVTGIKNWKDIRSLELANVYRIENPPDGFLDWAINAMAAVSAESDEEWTKVLE